MSPIRSSLLLGAGDAAAGGFQVSRSLRFNAADSAYLNRTPAVAGNRKTWTWSGWVKRSGFGQQNIFRGGTTTNDTQYLCIDFTSNHELRLSSATTNYLISTQVFRDPASWYHIVFAFDVTQGTNANKAKFYVNGTEITAFSTDARGSLSNQDYGVNQTQAHDIGVESITSDRYLNGYLADIHFIDGQALTPSSFTEVSATTGQLIPKAYTGTYGTNGFYLQFADNSNNTATTLGKDTSGNGNNWTPNNLSVTAGAGNDSLVDTPTSFGTDTGVGGEIRGNYCTLNPLCITTTSNSNTGVRSNGNLDFAETGSLYYGSGTDATLVLTTGKWYWEVTANNISVAGRMALGVYNGGQTVLLYHGSSSDNRCVNDAGSIYSGSTLSSSGNPTYTSGSVIGLSLDADAGELKYRVGSGSFTTIATGMSFSRGYCPALYGGGGTTMTANFGQRAFAYTAPSGFKALCDTNLGAPLVAKSSDYFQTVLYTGNGSTQTISGLGFSPDFVWIKTRSAGYYHVLYDIVRGTGTGKALYSNTTDAEGADSTLQNLTTFNSDGFSLGTTSGTNIINDSSQTRVAWCWDAGTTTTTNTVGSITSQVRANASAGFSVVTYTGTGSAGATVGHGLGVSPEFMIFKCRNDGTLNWRVYHKDIGNTKIIFLSLTNAATADSTFLNNTTPSSTVFTIGTDPGVNGSGGTVVAYCFAPVVGYSSFGTWTGAGTTNDGAFIYTGFRPRFILLKNTDNVEQWYIYDSSRSPYNVSYPNLTFLNPNTSASEGSYLNNATIDFVSNGFKIRGNTGSEISFVGRNYIYACFAENPFQYARAR